MTFQRERKVLVVAPRERKGLLVARHDHHQIMIEAVEKALISTKTKNEEDARPLLPIIIIMAVAVTVTVLQVTGFVLLNKLVLPRGGVEP